MTATADRPTLAQLRAGAQKQRHREIGNWLARRVARPSAIYGTWVAIRLGISANQVTTTALLFGIASAVSIATGERWGFVLGVILGHVSFWLDHVDGQVARWRGTVSLDGVYFDYLLHHAQNMALGFALGFGLAMQTGEVAWAAAGFLIAIGWAGLALHNDCRYKAFIQRLKSTQASYRVEGGAGGRPAPAPGWPRRGLGVLTYPAYKSCEPHVVLLGMTLAAMIAVTAPRYWEALWPLAVGLMAVTAPLLAVARVRRAILRGSAETEFQSWFHEVDARPPGRDPSRRPLDTGSTAVVSTSPEGCGLEVA